MNELVENYSIITTNQRTFPVNVEKIAEEMGIEIRREALGKHVSGKIIRETVDGRDKFVIYTNKSEHENRQRFTIAHELSHYILHKPLIGDGIEEDTLYRSKLSDNIEKEANQFAADILMPFRLIDKIMQDTPYIREIAEKLKVSPIALKIRLDIPVTD